jgi:hypothetical protein
VNGAVAESRVPQVPRPQEATGARGQSAGLTQSGHHHTGWEMGLASAAGDAWPPSGLLSVLLHIQAI